MIVIYHSRDLDGWMSAAIVKKKYPDIKLMGWDYGDSFPVIYDEKKYSPGKNEFAISNKEKVIMVDVAFDPEVMIYLRERAVKPLSFIWIDHHKSAMMDSVLHNYQGLAGTRDVEFAACELTWKYFFLNEPMPEIVRLLGRYDCFGHKGTDEEQKVLIFQYAARASLSNYEECYKALLSIKDSHIEGWLNSGQAIYNYLCTEAKQIYAKGFPVEFIEEKTTPGEHGHYAETIKSKRRFLCVNRERFNPINFGIDYHKDGYDGFACFWYKDDKWHWSLYNDNRKVDCSAIAKQYGGGGHQGAAGMVMDISQLLSIGNLGVLN